MKGKIERNKADKEISLLNSAYDLFAKTGINDTTIDKIVQKAGVAKGTFYLYFKNKYDIFDRIVLDKTSELIHAAVEDTMHHEYETRYEKIIFFISYIIDYLAGHKLLMKIIHKNLSYSMYRRLVTSADNNDDIKRIINFLKQDRQAGIYEENEINNLLFILIEMTGSVCYSSIIDNEPAPINEIKPVLLKTIKRIFES